MTIRQFKDNITGFEWIDVTDPTHQEIASLTKRYDLPKAGIVDCLDPKQLPKYEHMNGFNFVIVRYFDEEAASGTINVRHLTRKIGLFVSPERIISIHRIEVPFFIEIREQHWSKFETSPTPTHLELLTAIIEGSLETYGPGINELQANVEEFTSHIFSDESSYEKLKQKFQCRKQINVYRRMIKLIEDVLIKLKPLFGENNSSILQNLTETANNLYFYAQEIEENISSLMNLQMALSTHQVNEIMRVLTLFSVFFMPISFITGLYGMNFEHMPELKLQYGYLYVIGMILMVSLLTLWWFYRKNWIGHKKGFDWDQNNP